MSGRSYPDPEVIDASAGFSELINQSNDEASRHRVSAGAKLLGAAAVGVASAMVGISEPRSPIGYYSDQEVIVEGIKVVLAAGTTGILTALGVNSALRSIQAGSKASSLEALHHHDMYEALAKRQAQGRSSQTS